MCKNINIVNNKSTISDAASINSIASIDSIDSIEALSTNEEEKTVHLCCICLEIFEEENLYATETCDHRTCQGCMSQYLNDAAKDTRYKDYEFVYCPGLNCDANFTTGELVSNVFAEKDEEEAWWSRALTRIFIPNSIVCPFEDCNELFDADETVVGECVFTECQKCHRGFCLTCRKSWHAEDESSLSRNVRETTEKLERMMLDTAERENWSKCPRCKHMVEKRNGCDHINCRCGTQFCYRCGSLYGSNGCISRCMTYSPEALRNARKPMFYVERFDRNHRN